MALRNQREHLIHRAMEEQFSGKIRDISSEGHGVVDHPSGKVFFVRGTWPGDEGEFVIESSQKKYGTARLKRLIKAAPERQVPRCAHLGWEKGLCGGCPWMIASYEAQLAQKQKRVEYLVQRNQLAAPEFVVSPIQKSPQIYGYRNRAQFKTNGTKLGYVSPESKEIADVKDCLILTEKNRQTLQNLREQLPNDQWKPGSSYMWNFIDINEEMDADHISLNRRLVFQQGNTEQNDFMKNWVRKKIAEDNKTKPLIELFGGSGNFTNIFSAAEFEKIYLAEVDKKAVEKLVEKKITGVQGFVVDLYKPAQWKKIPREALEAEILFLDPPREGFTHLQAFTEKFRRLRKIIYVSCEPYQWSRDIKNIVQKNWRLVEALPVDQFPQTPHTELLSVLVRTDKF
jgi:23S rRNA (uracil1939-C5)-methyltransferase